MVGYLSNPIIVSAQSNQTVKPSRSQLRHCKSLSPFSTSWWRKMTPFCRVRGSCSRSSVSSLSWTPHSDRLRSSRMCCWRSWTDLWSGIPHVFSSLLNTCPGDQWLLFYGAFQIDKLKLIIQKSPFVERQISKSVTDFLDDELSRVFPAPSGYDKLQQVGNGVWCDLKI